MNAEILSGRIILHGVVFNVTKTGGNFIAEIHGFTGQGKTPELAARDCAIKFANAFDKLQPAKV